MVYLAFSTCLSLFFLLFLKAFFSGKLKIAGNTGLAMKLQNIIPKPPKSKL